jgi:hypothetical protein
MNSVPVGMAALVVVMGVLQLSWYVAVIVFLYKIWVKVRHLPT